MSAEMTHGHYQDVDLLLALAFAAIQHKEKKDMRKTVLKLARKAAPIQRQAILGNIIPDEKRSLRDAKDNIWFHVNNFLAVVVPAQEIALAGNHGMVIYEDTAYPIHLTAEEDEDWEWCHHNEHIIQLTALDGLMSKLGVRHMAAKVCLFQTYGFSGVTEPIEVTRDGINKESQRIGDSNFFF